MKRPAKCVITILSSGHRYLSLLPSQLGTTPYSPNFLPHNLRAFSLEEKDCLHKVDTTDLASTARPAVIATSTTMASPTNAEDISRKFPFSNARIPDLRQAAASMTPSQHTQNRLRSKAKLAVPHLLVLFAGLAYLISTCTLLSTGLQGFSGILDTQIEEVSFKLRAQGSITWRENVLESRIDKLEHTQLDSKFMETYEACLARGVQEADVQLMGFGGFQYPNFRNRTIDWTVENCGRLHHAPHVDQPSVQQDVLNKWAQISYRGRYLAKKAMLIIEHRVKPLQNWLFNATGADFFTSAEPLIPAVAKPLTCAMLTVRLHMPDGFRLVGEASPCHLEYLHLKKAPKDKATMDKDALADTKLKVRELFRIHRHINVVSGATGSIVAWSMPLEVFILILYVVSLFASEFDLNQHTPGDWVSTSVAALRSHSFNIQEQYAAIFIFAQTNAALVGGYMQHALYPEHLIVMIMCSVTMLLHSFISGMNVTVFPQMYRALKELYGIAKQPDVLTIQALLPMPRTQSDVNIGKHAGILHQSDVLTIQAPMPALVPMPRTQSHVDIATHTGIPHQPDETSVPLQEPTSAASSSHTELGTKVDEPHTQDLAGDTRNETEYLAQSEDSNSPSGDEDYVDLAGGISPTISEDQEWAVVDA